MTREELNKFIADFQKENEGKRTWEAFHNLHDALWEDVSDEFGDLKGQSDEFERYGLKHIAIVKQTYCIDFCVLNKPKELYQYHLIYGKETVYQTDIKQYMLYFLSGFITALRTECEKD